MSGVMVGHHETGLSRFFILKNKMWRLWWTFYSNINLLFHVEVSTLKKFILSESINYYDQLSKWHPSIIAKTMTLCQFQIMSSTKPSPFVHLDKDKVKLDIYTIILVQIPCIATATR